MAYLTPDSATTTYAPFVVYLPVDDTTGIFLIDYAALFAGVLMVLCDEKNYTQYGTQTPAYTANVFQNVLDLTFPLQGV